MDVTDEQLVEIARRYGAAMGSQALAERSGWSQRHARRIMDGEVEPKRLNQENRNRLTAAIPDMLEELKEAEEAQRRAAEALRALRATSPGEGGGEAPGGGRRVRDGSGGEGGA